MGFKLDQPPFLLAYVMCRQTFAYAIHYMEFIAINVQKYGLVSCVGAVRNRISVRFVPYRVVLADDPIHFLGYLNRRYAVYREQVFLFLREHIDRPSLGCSMLPL
jgi:hypothetical protein